MKLGIREGIAVVIGIIVIAIFFVVANIDSTPGVDVVEEQLQNITIHEDISMSDELIIDDLVVGEGKEATVGSRIVVHYTGTLEDGTVFDSSKTRGAPFEFVLGVGQVIQGWEQGFNGMKVGGVRSLVIPPSFAYGDNQVGSIPPGSTLLFEVELIDVIAQ